jgi:hypothetical protein
MKQRENMKRILILALIVFAAGCSSSKNAGGGSGTSMQGTWTVSGTGNFGSQSGSGTYQVVLVSSPCSVTTPVGTFSVQGPVCFIANNNSAQGSISGTGLPSSSKNNGQGVLVGVASNPVPANAPINLLFVVGESNGTVLEFTGSATVANGTITGTGSCSTSTPLCQGATGTFSANLQ